MESSAVQIVSWIARGLVAAIFLVMGVNHFRPRVAQGMAASIPPSLRWNAILRPINLVYITGVCELAGGVGILVPVTSLAAAICLVVFLIVVFPANAHLAAHPEKFGRASIPLWPRLIAQLVLIAIVLVAGLLR
jgi:uncharacterized membrane protein